MHAKMMISVPIYIFYSSILSLFLILFFFIRRLNLSVALPPGPRPWPIVGNLPHLGSAPHHALADLARTYGPLMYLRLGSVDAVVASSSKIAMKFLKTHDANFSNRPKNSGAKYIAYDYQDLVFAPYGPRWRLLRKICNVHLFSTKAMDDFRHVREEEVARLMNTLSTATDSPLQLGPLLNLCTINALGRAMFGKRVFGNDQSKADVFRKMVVELMDLAGVFNIGDFIPVLECLDLQGMRAKMQDLHARFDSFLTAVVENFRAEHEHDEPKNFLSTLISLKDDGDGENKLTDTEIKALLLNMFTAGTDTSSSTVEWAMAELIRHPRILAQAQQELDHLVGRDRLVSESDLAQLTYLQAIVKETFRLHPSTPLSLPRVASESCEINGHRIPKGATLLVNVWAIARDPDVWAEPLEFRPDRFLLGGERPNADVKGNDFEVMPFGAGRRICVGMNLGLRMVQLLTATLVQAFDWALPVGLEVEKLNMKEAYGLTLQRAEPLCVNPRPRLLKHVYGSRGAL